MIYLFAQCGCARLLPGWFPHHGFLWIQFIAPAIELTPRYSQLLCQCHDVLASSQSLHSHLPEVLRIPSLCHLQFLSCKVCLVLLSHFWGSLQLTARASIAVRFASIRTWLVYWTGRRLSFKARSSDSS